MKKLLFATLLLLAVGATAAMADSINLGYVCRTAANNATASTNDFSPVAAATAAGGTCDDGISYVATKRWVCTFKTTTQMLNFSGTSVALDVLSTTPLPAFWDVGAGGCAAGNIDLPNTMSGVGITGCTNPYTITPTDAQSDNNAETTDIPNGRVHIFSYHVRNTTAITLAASAGSGYVANSVGVKPDAAATCPGCDKPACIALNEVHYFSTTEDRTVTTQDMRQFVTWNGGTGANCPGAVPTHTTTWGQVKALYR